MTYGDFEDLARKTATDKILRYKESSIAKNPKHGGYQCRLALMVYNFFDKQASPTFAWSETLRSETLATQATRNKFAGSGIKNENISNKELAKELHKPITRKVENRKYTNFYR